MNNRISMELPNNENDGMETAIELNQQQQQIQQRQRPKNAIEKLIYGMEYWFLIFTSETAMTAYILIHWLLGCICHIVTTNKEEASFLSFVYFMVALTAFLSILSHVSGLLVPMFIFCCTGSFLLFFMVNLSMIDAPGADEYYKRACNTTITLIYCKEMNENPIGTIVKTYLLIIFFAITCAAIAFQFARNEEYLRAPPPPQQLHPLYWPNLMPREIPVGATDLDEPPRYSSLEPISPPKPAVSSHISSTVTSPPRYSYWERTFGRRTRTTSQCSDASLKSSSSPDDGRGGGGEMMMTARSH